MVQSTTIIKILFTIFILILIPTYWVTYGPQNFLWLSDIGLFATCLALWLESNLLISTVAISILPVEILWNITFIIQLITGYSTLGVTDYMFSPQYSLFVKCLSLFHIVIPLFWLCYLFKFGYNKRALGFAPTIIWSTLILTYLFTDPRDNINFAFMPVVYNWLWISPLLWLAIIMIIFFISSWFMHTIFKRIF